MEDELCYSESDLGNRFPYLNHNALITLMGGIPCSKKRLALFFQLVW